MAGKSKAQRRREQYELNRAALDRIAAERVEAGLCRHCGGPVPCWSPYGDVRPGERHPK